MSAPSAPLLPQLNCACAKAGPADKDAPKRTAAIVDADFMFSPSWPPHFDVVGLRNRYVEWNSSSVAEPGLTTLISIGAAIVTFD